MPFLRVELDAMKRVGEAARACGATEAEVGWGLCLLWRWTFDEKTATVERRQLRCFFGPHDVCEALVDAGFLEPDGEAFRVRGASRYLGLREARRRGGLAAKQHLVPGARQRKESLGTCPESAESASGQASGLPSALSPSTKHQAPSTKQETTTSPRKQRAERQEKPTDPRHAPTVKALADAFLAAGNGPLAFDGRQAKAVSALLALGAPEDVLARWRRALGRSTYPTVRTPAELAAHWNHFATDSPANGKSPIRAETQQHGEPGDATQEFLNAF